MELAGLGVVSLLQGIHLHTESRIRDRGFVLLRHVQLALLREPRASVPLTQDLELRLVCGELLRETLLRWDGARRSRLQVLGSRSHHHAGRASCLRLYASWSRLSCGRTRVPELGVLGASGRRWRWRPGVCRHAAARAGWFATGCSVQS